MMRNKLRVQVLCILQKSTFLSLSFVMDLYYGFPSYVLEIFIRFLISSIDRKRNVFDFNILRDSLG